MIETTSVNEPVTQRELHHSLLLRIEAILKEADEKSRPLEMEPYRGNLFEVFVLADGAGLLTDLEPNLQSDSIAKALADRWQLRESVKKVAQSAAASLEQQSLNQMRLLWAFLRMWMEWTYAWSRWVEFHDGKQPKGV